MHHYPMWQVATAAVFSIGFMIALRWYLEGVSERLTARWDRRKAITRREAQHAAQRAAGGWTEPFRQPEHDRVTLSAWEDAAFMTQTMDKMPHRPPEPGIPECTCGTCAVWRSYQW